MANCRINSINDSRRPTENFPRQGKVNEVCREFLVHEDQALAYRLQNEEYKHHLVNNKERNALLRQDTPKARQEQLREDEEAARAQYAFEMSLVQQEAKDAEVAAQLARQLDMKENEKKLEQEQKDMELAKSLMHQEKSKVRQAKERRQVEREAAYLGINAGLDNVAILSRSDKRRPRNFQLNESNLSDLSDFCLKPSPSMDEEEIRWLQEGQDEEVARLLQEQDLKRRGDLLQEDQLMAIEAQDRELAKILQEQEKAKAKKAREKAKQKAILKKQHRSLEEQPTDSPHNTSMSSNNSGNIYETPHFEEERPSSPQYASLDIRESGTPTSSPPRPLPSSGMVQPLYSPIRTPQANKQKFSPNSSIQSNSSSAGRSRDREPVNNRQPYLETHTPSRNSASPDSQLRMSTQYTNIACAIDPTYERRVRSGELGGGSPGPYNVSTNSSTSSKNSGHIATPAAVIEEEEEEDFLPPPYMPIQGQRRISSLEKKHKIKKKDGGCKQQ